MTPSTDPRPATRADWLRLADELGEARRILERMQATCQRVQE